MTGFTVPAFFRTPGGTYWHRPRVATQQAWGWSWRAWCGGTGHGDITWTDAAGSDVCGTCDGRMQGAMPDGPLVFTPRGATPPRHCPGGARLDYAFERVGARVGRCLVCGALEPLRAKGAAHSPREGLAAHAPGDGIADSRCDEHGWSDLVVRDGTIECRCGPLGGVAP